MDSTVMVDAEVVRLVEPIFTTRSQTPGDVLGHPAAAVR